MSDFDGQRRLEEFVAAVESRTGRTAHRRGRYFDLRCPAHDDKSPSLTVWLDDKGRIATTCRAGCKRDDVLAGAGWTWRDAAPPLAADDRRPRAQRTAVIRIPAAEPEAPARSPAEWAEFAEACTRRLTAERLADLAERLGLDTATLRRQAVGWCDRTESWTWPMTAPDGSIVGIRVRYSRPRPDGRTKGAITGTRGGLFVPGRRPGSGPLLICEGPTSCAALLQLGFDAVGRESAWASHPMVVDLVRASGGPDVVIVADNDKPDKRGRRAGPESAEVLARRLALVSASVRTVVVPVEKDARDWLHAGATAADVEAAIAAAPPLQVSIRVTDGESEVTQ